MADWASFKNPELTSKTKIDPAKSGTPGVDNNSNSGINSGIQSKTVNTAGDARAEEALR